MSYETNIPQAVEAEALILGSILKSNYQGLNEVMEYVLGRTDPLTAEQFHVPAHREMFIAFQQTHEAGNSINLLTIHEMDGFSPADGLRLISDVESYMVRGDRKSVEELVDMVQEKYYRRQLIAHYHAQSQVIFDPLIDTASAIAEYQNAVTRLGERKQEKAGLLHISESLTDTLNQLEARIAGVVEPYLRTGWTDFDHRFGGIPEGVSIFMGRPAMGKTAAALTLALNAAIRHQSVLIFSLEMDAKQLNNRFLSMLTGIAGTRIRRGELYDGEEVKIVEAVAFLSELDINIMDCPTSVEDVQRKVQLWGRRHNRKPDLVIVDYLQLLVTEDKKRDPYAEISHISRQLQRLAKFFKIRPSDRPDSFPLVAVCQLSRAVESRPNKRPKMSDLRDSGQLEQDAEFIVGFYRDEYYNPNTVDLGVAEAIVVKNRDGQCGTVKLLFQEETTRFHDLPKEA